MFGTLYSRAIKAPFAGLPRLCRGTLLRNCSSSTLNSPPGSPLLENTRDVISEFLCPSYAAHAGFDRILGGGFVNRSGLIQSDPQRPAPGQSHGRSASQLAAPYHVHMIVEIRKVREIPESTHGRGHYRHRKRMRDGERKLGLIHLAANELRYENGKEEPAKAG